MRGPSTPESAARGKTNENEDKDEDPGEAEDQGEAKDQGEDEDEDDPLTMLVMKATAPKPKGAARAQEGVNHDGKEERPQEEPKRRKKCKPNTKRAWES